MLEFVCLPWSEVCSARVTSLLLLFIMKAFRNKSHTSRGKKTGTKTKQKHRTILTINLIIDY